jgi:hypothetical protein
MFDDSFVGIAFRTFTIDEQYRYALLKSSKTGLGHNGAGQKASQRFPHLATFRVSSNDPP